MSDAREVAVFDALAERMEALVFSPAIVVAYPNVRSTPPVAAYGVEWLRVSFLPSATLGLGVDDLSSNQYYGILQVDAMVYAGGGQPPALRLAQTVADWFARGTTMTKNGQQVRVWKTPFFGPMLEDDPWVFVPVSVPYVAFAQNPAAQAG